MVLCLIALPIFAILGIFSIKYRKLAKDSLHCLLKTATFRKCESGLDDRIKSRITGSLLKWWPGGARFTYKHYKAISWIILILFLWSAVEGGIGAYNYVQYGNCNGPDETGFCILDPMGANSATCAVSYEDTGEEIKSPELEENDPILGNPDAELTIIEFGCYVCPYTRKAESTIKEVLEEYDGKVNVQFKSVLMEHHEYSTETSILGECAIQKGVYEEYHENIFREEVTNSSLESIKQELGLNCTDTGFMTEVEADTKAAEKAKIQGTPTFFINDQVIVGPKPLRTFKNIIEKELK